MRAKRAQGGTVHVTDVVLHCAKRPRLFSRVLLELQRCEARYNYIINQTSPWNVFSITPTSTILSHSNSPIQLHSAFIYCRKWTDSVDVQGLSEYMIKIRFKKKKNTHRKRIEMNCTVKLVCCTALFKFSSLHSVEYGRILNRSKCLQEKWERAG